MYLSMSIAMLLARQISRAISGHCTHQERFSIISFSTLKRVEERYEPLPLEMH
jgi:hypothetical protein